MPITITLTDAIHACLQDKAKSKHCSAEELALQILSDALAVESPSATPEEVVARIRATPPNPGSIRPASGSLADALRNAPRDPDFSLEVWQRQWRQVEAEMRAITRANDIAEGRG